MSSDSIPVSFVTSHDGDNLPDLQNIFQHPAGLRTARFIVSSFLKASSNTNASANGDFSFVSPPFLDSDGSSSEAAKILRDLLAFKDTEEQREEITGFASSSSQAFEQPTQFPAVSRSTTSLSQMVASNYSNSSPNITVSTNGYTPLQAYNVSNTYSLNGSATVPSQPRHGTDSPYRVESPFQSDSNSEASFHSSSSKTQSPSLSSLRQGSNQYNIDHPLHLTRTLSSYSNDNTSTGDLVTKGGMTYTIPASRVSGRPPPQKNSSTSNTGRAIAKELPSIKSFLPVNKGGEGQNMPTRKELPIVNSTTNRRLMPNSLAPANNSNQRTSELGNFMNFSQLSRTQNLLHDTPQSAAMEISNAKGASKKRKSKGDVDGASERNKKTSEKGDKVKRVPKVKIPKPEPARYRIGLDLWMRILEFTPPAFIRKARLLNREFRTLVETYQSIYLNQRLENYGPDMPAPRLNITEKQYNDLLSGKGCMEPGCSDLKASRTHWSWEIRLCQNCWKSKIEREDRLQKMWQNQLTRTVINDLLECIPVGMHDSFMKPHDYIEDNESRPRGAPRLYKYHFKSDVEKIVAEYETLKAPPFQENPEHSAAEKASALVAHQTLETEAAAKRADFVAKRKEKNTEHMKRVVKIETCIRNRRVEVAKPYDANRNARKERFTKGAESELAHIPMDFVRSTKAYKAAVRIFRDPGTERGWQLLKPKIQDEWDKSAEKKALEERTNGATTDDTTTRETSVTNEAEQTPDPTLDQIQHQVQRQAHVTSHAFHTSHQQFPNMGAPQRNDFLLRTNEHNQFRPASYHPGMNQLSAQGYQSQSVPNSLMLHTASYPNESLNRNDFGMSGPALQVSSNYFSYGFPTGNNFASFPGNSAAQGSNTQIPIDSLLNGPSAAAAHGFDPWA